MAKMRATDTRVEEGFGSFAGQWYGYAKQDTSQDELDQYDYRYVEVGPFKSKEEAQKAADQRFAQLQREGPVVRKATKDPADRAEEGDE